MSVLKITAAELRSWKGSGRKIAALTAYDYPMTRLLDETNVADVVAPVMYVERTSVQAPYDARADRRAAPLRRAGGHAATSR